MGKAEPAESRLRRRLTRLLKRPGRIGAAIRVLREWESRGWAPILFGGVVRDFFILGSRRYPRDIDIVLASATTDDIISDLAGSDYRINRFGGIHLNLSRWSFDVWSIDNTWAFRVDPALSATPASLPKTTFLDVEAIAVTLKGPDKIGHIYSNGFFRAVAERCIGINYERNPFPALAAVRSIMLAYKLQFQISRELGSFIVRSVEEFGRQALIDAQEQHYKRVVFRESDIEEILAEFRHQLRERNCLRLSLPERYRPIQLSFWGDVAN